VDEHGDLAAGSGRVVYRERKRWVVRRAYEDSSGADKVRHGFIEPLDVVKDAGPNLATFQDLMYWTSQDAGADNEDIRA
jgi:hypothetical protein